MAFDAKHPQGKAAHEPMHTDVGPVVKYGVALVVAVAVVLAVSAAIYSFLSRGWASRQSEVPFLSDRRAERGGPALDGFKEKDEELLGEIRRHDQGVLNSNGWVDREKGTVHIKIERAMELVVERSATTRPAGEGGGLP